LADQRGVGAHIWEGQDGPASWVGKRPTSSSSSASVMDVVLLKRLSGLISHASSTTFVDDRSRLLREDGIRRDKLARLRWLLPSANGIVGVDLADRTQAAVITDHDSRVLARHRVSCRPWELGELLDWAVQRARSAGFASVTVVREPTGHRWRVLDQLAAERWLASVCVQPLVVWRGLGGRGPDLGQVGSVAAGYGRSTSTGAAALAAGRPDSARKAQQPAAHGRVKSKAGRRTVGLPAQLVTLLRRHRVEQEAERSRARPLWHEEGWCPPPRPARRSTR
jgi:hypothetical protein